MAILMDTYDLHKIDFDQHYLRLDVVTRFLFYFIETMLKKMLNYLFMLTFTSYFELLN